MTTTIETRLVRALDAARVAAHAEVQAVNVTWDEAYRNGQMDVLRSDVDGHLPVLDFEPQEVILRRYGMAMTRLAVLNEVYAAALADEILPVEQHA